MDKSKSGIPSVEYPKRSKEWMLSLISTQLEAIKEGEEILRITLSKGIASADVEFKEELCFDIEGLIDYKTPNVLRSFRHLFSILYHFDNPNVYPEIIAHINYLLSLIERGRKYLEFRIDEGMDPDLTSQIESHLGYYWKDQDLLGYNLFEDHSEILQLAFVSRKEKEKYLFEDMGYWLDLKKGQILITRRFRPFGAAKYMKENNSEFDVLQLNRMFIYPGKINRRIRWKGVEKRTVTQNDISTVLNYAENNYTEMCNAMKESFRDPLAEQSPAALIKLHKVFANGEHLVLQDQFGGMLTVMDATNDKEPTEMLLQSILPAKPEGCALLIRVNHEIKTRLFSVKPLSIITPNRIIRLLY